MSIKFILFFEKMAGICWWRKSTSLVVLHFFLFLLSLCAIVRPTKKEDNPGLNGKINVD